jgi:hypothetical protein
MDDMDRYVARVGYRRGATGYGWGGLREGDDLEDLSIHGRIILK